MNKLFVVGLIFLLMVVSVTAVYDYCYQESVNVSTSCNGINLPTNGTTNGTSYFNVTQPGRYSYDGLNSTYAQHNGTTNSTGTMAETLENYTIPVGVSLTSALLYRKHNSTSAVNYDGYAITNINSGVYRIGFYINYTNYSRALGGVKLQDTANVIQYAMFDNVSSTNISAEKYFELGLYWPMHYGLLESSQPSGYDFGVGFNSTLNVNHDGNVSDANASLIVGGTVFPASVKTVGASSITFVATSGNFSSFASMPYNWSYNISFSSGALNGTNVVAYNGSTQKANVNLSFVGVPSGNHYNVTCNGSHDIISREGFYYFLNGAHTLTCDGTDFYPAFSNSFTISISANNTVTVNVSEYVFNVSFFSAANGSSLAGTSVMSVLSNAVWSRTNTSTSGWANFSNLTSGVYDLLVSASGFSSQSYVVTLGSVASMNLSVYLLNASASAVVLTATDSGNNDAIIPGVGVVQFQFVNGSLVAIANGLTDVTGKIQFNFIPGLKYVFVFSKAGYESYTFTLNPILYTAYDVPLTPLVSDDQGYGDVSVYWQPWVFWNNQTNSFIIVFGSGSGTLSAYNYSLTYPGGNCTNSSSLASGTSFPCVFNTTGATLADSVMLDYWYSTSFGRSVSGRAVYGLSGPWGNYTLVQLRGNTYGMSLFERILVVTIIVIILAGLVTLAAGSLVGVVFGLLIYGVFAMLVFIPAYVVVGVAVVGFFIVSRRSGEGYG